MLRRNTRDLWLMGAASSVLAAAGVPCARAAFPPPQQANPAAEYTAEIPIDYSNVQSYSRTITYDSQFNPYPRLYWFKYTSNGRTALKLDTLGSNFGSTGSGGVLGLKNHSQVAVYTAAGQLKGIAQNTRDLNGDPIPLYPTYSSNPDEWYVSQGLTEAYFAPGIPTRNPHWDADPNDPTGFTAWAAPGNEGNSQRYFPPHYPTTLNEYHVWSTALSPVMLDMDGNPVLNDQGQPRSQPGWRYYDRARHGPGTPWNRFEQLPPGEYYIAVSSTDPVFAGDTYREEVLRAPIHYDASTMQNNQQILTEPMGPFQYYLSDPVTPGSFAQFGTINLNVTQTPAPATLHWVGNLAGGAWDVQTTQNWKNGAVADQFYQGDYVVFGDDAVQATVNLAAAVTPGAVTVDSDQSFTFTGTGAIGGAGSLTKSGGGRLTIANTGVNTYTGGTSVVGGTLELAAGSTIGAGPLAVGSAGFAQLAPGRASAVRVSSLDVEAGGTVDVANNAVVVDYAGASPLAQVLADIQAGGIATSSGANYAVGYAEASALANVPAIFGSVDADALLLRGTRGGDANLDGLVNLTDFNALAANFGQGGRDWVRGDFNYDGLVNLTDFNRLAANFGLAASGPEVTPQDWSNLASAVPEPAAPALGLLAALGLARRRRQRLA